MASLNETLLTSLDWRCIGPHRGGRCVAVVGDESDAMTFYFGACAGGVWKTTDGGTYWRNISDGYFGTAAIGALAVAPSDPNVLYAGTGEACIRNNVSHGDGVYKSTDAGKTWRHVGLRDSRHIGAVRIHPTNPNVVYVAALGHAFGPNEERGVFRTTDGGRTWERVLFKSSNAGSHDISIDPRNPRVLYAAIWQTRRYPHALDSGGPESGLWRSVDGGDTWTAITRSHGLPTGALGKIGVAVSPARSGRVWALVEAKDGALFRSDDAGETWLRLSEDSVLRTRPWYYIHVFADPRDSDTCWVLNYKAWKSIDGGKTFSSVPTPHGDNHGLWIDPRNPLRMIEGNDGGACVTFDGGASWSSIYNQPTAQLYHVITDDQFPYRVYGSQQDNTAISIPSLSLTGSITQQDWYVPGGGESGYIAIKHDDPNIVAASGPAGRRIFNDYMTLYDHRTRQKRDITVWPNLYGWGVGAEGLKYRFNWTFPIVFSRHEVEVLYACSNVVHRSRDLGASWEVISPDLTRNDPSKLATSGGPVTRDNTGAEVYCTIFALVESPHAPGVLWAGSDDGLVHITRDGGQVWTSVTPPADLLPEWALISIIEPSPHDPATAYVAATRYKLDDSRPYLLKTTDYGATWTSITGDLPDDAFTRVIREDPNRAGLLYVGTETGLFVSFDDGRHWETLTGNFPVVPVYDLVVKGVELVVATHGRSFWILDDLTPLHQLSDQVGDTSVQLSDQLGDALVHLFKPRPTYRLRLPSRRAAEDEPHPGLVEYARVDASLVSKLDGTLLDAGANPPAGMQIIWYLREAPDDEVSLDILDQQGQLVRSFCSASVDGQPPLVVRIGLNRHVWNMRRAGAVRVLEDGSLKPWHREDGPLVLPGQYQVRLTVGDREFTQTFDILPDPRLGDRTVELTAQHEFLLTIYDRLSLTNTLINRISLIQDQVAAWQRWSPAEVSASAIRSASDAPAEVAASPIRSASDAPAEDAASPIRSASDAPAEDAASPIRSAGDVLAAQLAELKLRLIDVHYGDAQLYSSGLHEKFNALIEFVDSADCAPAQQAREVFGDLSEQLEAAAHKFEGEVAEQARALASALGAARVPHVGIPDSIALVDPWSAAT